MFFGVFWWGWLGVDVVVVHWLGHDGDDVLVFGD